MAPARKRGRPSLADKNKGLKVEVPDVKPGRLLKFWNFCAILMLYQMNTVHLNSRLQRPNIDP